jgi:hypothetical protein
LGVALISAALSQVFLDGEDIPGVSFRHNDAVRIIQGAHAGAVGAIVALLSLEPEPLFVIELTSGRDVEALQSEVVSC